MVLLEAAGNGSISYWNGLHLVRGAPEHIRSDNGPEFVAKSLPRWLDRACVKTLFVAKASPWENGNIESFNSRFRQELLDRELFLGQEDARRCVDRWHLDYNHHRPHNSLGYAPPAGFAARWAASAPGPAAQRASIQTSRFSHTGWHIDRGKTKSVRRVKEASRAAASG